MRSASVLIILSVLGAAAAHPAAADPELPPVAASGPVDFVRHIQPLFAEHCLTCHGPDKQKSDYRLDVREVALKGGKSGEPAILPGQSARSPLIQFVAGVDPDTVMPPEKSGEERLTPGQIGLLRAWIDQGADWPDAATAKVRDPRDWWSFRPVVRTPVPAGVQPIDFFIARTLATKGLTPSAPADRATLIRRLFFDVIGLPPSPEEVGAFVSDESAGAYERLVEQLLASPHYGERWARHWLDVVRFAETNGFETNTPRRNAWPYRDYVIRALNEDKPFDRFIIEQIAGDAFETDEATGFLVAGAWDEVKSPDQVLTAQQRADELHDIVSTAGSAFLGLTVGCARCHNHKFDPISQTDYYAIKACFAGVQHGERKLRNAASAARQQEVTDLRQRLAGVDAQLAAYDREAATKEAELTRAAPLAQVGIEADSAQLRPAVNARFNADRFTPVTTKRLRFTVTRTSDAEPCLDEIEVYTPAEPQRNVALASGGTVARASGVFADPVRHRLEFVNDGRHGNERSWISEERGAGWVELEFPQPLEIDRVLWARDRHQKYRDRVPIDYRIEVETAPKSWHLVASAQDRAAFVAGEAKAGSAMAGLDAAAQANVDRLQKERAALQQQISAADAALMAYVGTFVPPPPTFKLHRGDPMQPREEVKPGALSEFAEAYSLSADATDQQRRTTLARWIAAPENPLTARVTANRVWQYHFGEGLVSTPSDFGANGAPPSHPELLDWLASELVAQGWRLKHLHRLILCSATYRQSSKGRAEALAIDAGSRLLWRFPSRRLEAEPIRDAILHVSGTLDLSAGGAGFSTFKPNDNYVRVYDPLEEFGAPHWRRMIYMTRMRMQPDGTFGVFDCPDGGQIAPRRTRSTTPLQALNLFNSRFLLQQAEFFAARVCREAGEDPRAQIDRAFRLAFGRPVAAEELEASTKLIAEHGLPLLCRALFNANEFVYVF